MNNLPAETGTTKPPASAGGRAPQTSRGQHNKKKTGKGKSPAKRRPTSLTRLGTSVLEGFNPPQSTKELFMTATHYFDSTGGDLLGAWQQILYDTRQQYFPSYSTGTGSGASRIMGCRLYAYAGYNPSILPSDALCHVCYDLPVTDGAAGAAAAQRSTTLIPSLEPSYTLVGAWKATTVFGDSVVEPSENATFNTVLGTVAVFDSEMVQHSPIVVQFKHEIDIAAALPVITTCNLAVVPGNTIASWNTPLAGDTEPVPCFVRMKGIGDRT